MMDFVRTICAGGVGLCVAAVVAVAPTSADEPGTKPLAELKSGYDFAIPETQAMQDDDFNNPAMLLVDAAAEDWTTVDGKAGKSCMTCHGDAAERHGE